MVGEVFGGLSGGGLFMPSITVILKDQSGKVLKDGHIKMWAGPFGYISNAEGDIDLVDGDYKFTGSIRRGYVTIAVTAAYDNSGAKLADATIKQLHLMADTLEIEMAVESTSTETTVPSAPTLYLSYSGSSAIFTWNAPASDGGSPITGYKMYLTKMVDGSVTEIDVGNVRTKTLQAGVDFDYSTVYHVTVSAVNANGEGDESNYASLTRVSTTPPVTPPLAPTLSVSYSGTKATLAWTVPASIGGSPITKYMMHITRMSDMAKDDHDVGNVNTYTVQAPSGIYYDTTYQVKVSAVNSAGEGAQSNMVQVRILTPTTPGGGTFVGTQGGTGYITPSRTPTIPSAPTNCRITHSKKVSGLPVITLMWDIPADNGGTPILYFNLYRAKNSTMIGASKVLTGILTNVTEYTVSEVASIDYFAVTATNAQGESAKSNSAAVTPL